MSDLVSFSYSPNHKQFFLKLADVETQRPLTIFREVDDPGATFEETHEMMKRIRELLAFDGSIFELCLKSIPSKILMESLLNVKNRAPSEEQVARDAKARGLDVEAFIALHRQSRADLAKALLLDEAVFKEQVYISHLQLHFEAQMIQVTVSWGDNQMPVMFVAVPFAGLSVEPHELVGAEIQRYDGDADECPYCAAGVPHPDAHDLPGERVTEQAPVKKPTLH